MCFHDPSARGGVEEIEFDGLKLEPHQDWTPRNRTTAAVSPRAFICSWLRPAAGSIREGGVVTIEARLGEEIRVVDNRVTRFDPERALCWHSMNWFEPLARGTRCRFLEPVGMNSTLFRHHEIMEGPLSWLIEKIYRPRIEAGLAQMNGDLKRAAEGSAQ